MPPQVITVSDTLSNGQDVSTTSTIPENSVDGVIEFDHTIDIGANNSQAINVAVVVDTSGSTVNSSGSDVDGDGDIDDFLEAQVIAAKALFQNYVDLGYDPSRVSISLFEYGSTGRVIGTFNLADQAAFDAALDGLDSNGLTNYADPLSDVYTEWANNGVTPDDSNTVVFLSDGRVNRGGRFDDEAQDLIDDFGANISGIGVGANAVLNGTGGSLGGLNDLDNTGGAVIVNDAADLLAEINSPPPNVDVDSVTVVFAYQDPADPSNTLTVTQTFEVGAPGSPLQPTPNGYALNNQLVDLDPDPPVGTDIQIEITTSFDNGETTISTGFIPVPAVPCFTENTLILTDKGEVPASQLRPGDLVFTLDRGFQPVRWVGLRHIPGERLRDDARSRPVRIKAGALGDATPSRDLLVSRQHRMLVHSQLAMRMFGASEILVAAVRMLELPGVDIVDAPEDGVTYVHVMFDQHELVVADGAFSESLFVSANSLSLLDADQKDELERYFPELFVDSFGAEAARVIPKGRKQKQLIHRMTKNNRRLWEPREHVKCTADTEQLSG